MNRPLGTTTVAILLALCGAAAGGGDTEPGSFSFELGTHGVLVRIPDGGLETVDGPRVQLRTGFAEWYGVSYRGPEGQFEAAGLGLTPDWAARRPVEPLRSWQGKTSTSIARAGDLEVRTDLTIEPSGPYLLGKVTLTNLGKQRISNVIYTREWRVPPGEGWTFTQQGCVILEPRCVGDPDEIPGLRQAPDDVGRRVWGLGALPPGASRGLRFSYQAPSTLRAAALVDVPLSLWTNDDFPTGLPVGETNGISFGDFDADGFIDMFACQSAHLWRNLGGTSWQLVADLDTILPATERRYGASFGDYNNDGLPDIGTEPRVPQWGDDKMYLLKNLGGGPNFVDVASDPAIVDVQPHNNGETLCWADVDGDRDLDAFLPVYPPWVSGPGNFFLVNQGPTGPGGAYRFVEDSAAAGLDIPPPDTTRPEGAQFADVDSDGDVDLYSNGTLYQNLSTKSLPSFAAMPEASSGIGLRTSLDEGAMLFDYDLDGDQDLFAVYTAEGVRIWESYGDGTFFAAEPTIVDDPLIGLNLGLSAEDWDNDGDIDFTTRQVFRRNMLMEEFGLHFTVATTSVPFLDRSEATPAWGDWDKDGDLDCALGNWGFIGHFYENTTYGPATPAADRRHLRVRAVGDSLSVPAGLETEYGATVEVHLLNGPDIFRRRKFVASSHGYLNQNEYTLHFALPDDPAPGDPDDDLHFDISVDFPELPSTGLWRVDRHVNPALGDVNLADLTDREIKVYRCGTVVIDGAAHDPIPLASPILTTTGGGLDLATVSTPLAAPSAVPPGTWYAGLAFDTLGATEEVRIHEIVLDGGLGAPVPCGGGSYNILTWDVTVPGVPFLVPGGALTRTTSPRNRRSYFHTDIVLAPGRSYRLVARVTDLRTSFITGPITQGPMTVLGGSLFKDSGACSGPNVAAAPVSQNSSFLALRFSSVPANTELDPVGDSLRVDLDASDRPVLSWADPQAVGYSVLRCSASAGACAPAMHASTPTNVFTDNDSVATSDPSLWYLIKAVNDCTAGL